MENCEKFKGYKIIENLGDGGNGSVFLVQDANGQNYAIKQLKSKGKKNIKRQQRFIIEACKFRPNGAVIPF